MYKSWRNLIEQSNIDQTRFSSVHLIEKFRRDLSSEFNKAEIIFTPPNTPMHVQHEKL